MIFVYIARSIFKAKMYWFKLLLLISCHIHLYSFKSFNYFMTGFENLLCFRALSFIKEKLLILPLKARTKLVHQPLGPLALAAPHVPASLGIPWYLEDLEIHAPPATHRLTNFKTRQQKCNIFLLNTTGI